MTFYTDDTLTSPSGSARRRKLVRDADRRDIGEREGKLTTDPEGAIIEARRALELIAGELCRVKLGSMPLRGRSLEKVLHDITKHIPAEIRVLMRTIQGLGNLAAHPESPLSAQSALVAVEALGCVEDYLEQSGHGPPLRRRRRYGVRALAAASPVLGGVIAILLSLRPSGPVTPPSKPTGELQPQEWIDLATEWKNQGNELFKQAKGYLNDDEGGIRQARESYIQSETTLDKEPPGLTSAIKERANLLRNDLHIRIQACEKELDPRQWISWPK